MGSIQFLLNMWGQSMAIWGFYKEIQRNHTEKYVGNIVKVFFFFKESTRKSFYLVKRVEKRS